MRKPTLQGDAQPELARTMASRNEPGPASAVVVTVKSWGMRHPVSVTLLRSSISGSFRE